ncbi:D-alanyl-D-alanine carboxypeptidase/D-alanyl-D-alanine-endopeptidase [Brevibacillus composti]|uniref:D-alanyl-D-alanine carboxypeptidase/D-alanyl-D-alanine-endopeptidase n=1 Tax=Brevibacillus composti TaxID=2796470 RepID=A0A7T5EHF8_9BACL|nr:D-alanyl-D-alanine carboxypeptidase/D-alanyl-D-alanine-endopeptidase [Brevibacillus composti]QQE72696.1 D-alanyl-D-alanine carboxypeptidase/D-alanyl-D-alanine-endopeptidase [Brevibacillus composti]QUO39774.1 D-alanyl-D-alanine carboxypeptidase/D-alanyl-D-alanine-endopeptidase [Brevibacillus composti]
MKRLLSRTGCWLLLVMLLFQLAAVPAFAQDTAVRAEPLAAGIEQLLAELDKNPESIGLHAGIQVYDLTEKKILYSHLADRTYVPASNMKLFTTIAALDRLGPDYQWKTEVYLTGEVSNGGVLNGDLVLKGLGDPSLTSADLQSIASALKEKGIEQVNGKLLVDDSYFDGIRLGFGWMWDDEPYGYSAQISALAVHKNAVNITVEPGAAAGDTPVLTMDPGTEYLQVDNQLQTVAGKGSQIAVERPRGTNRLIFTGTIGVDAPPYEEAVTMEDPALFAADIWMQRLGAAGIKLHPQAKAEKTTVTNGVPFYTHLSPPLSEIITELNKESDNFYAEMLLKTLGAVEKGEGSAEAGSEVVAEVLKRAGIEGGFVQKDGSGLSRFNWITASQMVRLLSFVQDQEYRDVFEQSLPVAGVDGTLKNRLKGTAAEKRVAAKTGSMGGVNTLSGYATAKNGNKLAFSILINGIYKSKYARDLQDRIAILLAEYPQSQAPGGETSEETTYKLSALLDPIVAEAEGAGITAGVLVKKAGGAEEAGEPAVWFEHEADTLLTPASNLKLLTTAAALDQLGSDYQYATELWGSAAPPSNGIYQGDLYLKGYGDPTLHTEDKLKVQEGVSIESIVAWLKEQGIKRVNGDLILDESYFDQQRLGLGWAWDDESYYYNPLLGALAMNRGTVMIEFEPGSGVGDPVPIQLLPKTDYVTVINEAKTVSADQPKTFAIERDRGTNTIHVTGNLPLGTAQDYERVPVENPALYVGTVLRETMEKDGISFGGNSDIRIGTVPAQAVKWTSFHSRPLSEIITYLNKRSDNFYAEMLLKTLGAVRKQEGSASAGVEVVMETLDRLGVPSNFDMVDGSGLTRYNLISPRHVAALLEGMAAHDEYQTYLDSLPIAGVDGTLANRMKGTAAADNARAKTGTLTGVSSLSGYVHTQDGQTLIFSIMLNGYTPKSGFLIGIQDRIVEALASYAD